MAKTPEEHAKVLTETLTRLAGMWLTHGECHALLGLIADHDPTALNDAMDRLDRIRAARRTPMEVGR
jgi:hypothetical protein